MEDNKSALTFSVAWVPALFNYVLTAFHILLVYITSRKVEILLFRLIKKEIIVQIGHINHGFMNSQDNININVSDNIRIYIMEINVYYGKFKFVTIVHYIFNSRSSDKFMAILKDNCQNYSGKQFLFIYMIMLVKGK